MGKLLKVTKPDKTTHAVPLANKGFYMSRNKQAKPEDQWKLEEIDESEVKDMPFIDVNHVTGAEAVIENEKLKKTNQDLAAELERLRKELSEKNSSNSSTNGTGADSENDHGGLPAGDVVAAIKAADTIEAVNQLAAGDTRKTVIAAAEKRIKDLQG